MDTPISSENPYQSYGRHAFAWESVPAGSKAHLDFGCFDGDFLRALKTKNINRRVGIDANRDAIAAAAKLASDVELIHDPRLDRLPFEDASFSSISLMDVIEHVHDQVALLKELRRILTPDGILIVTVPRQHIFSIFDLGNLKFRFPRIHRWYITRKYGADYYRSRYVANPDGMIGDISAEKAWHEHFSEKSMNSLLAQADFKVHRFDGSGLFFRPVLVSFRLVQSIRPIKRFRDRLLQWDAKRFGQTHLYCIARPRCTNDRERIDAIGESERTGQPAQPNHRN